MSPELIVAVRERFAQGYTKAQIAEEMRASGHSEETIVQVLDLVQDESGQSTSEISIPPLPSASVSLSSFGVLCKESLHYAWHKWSLVGWFIVVFVGFALAIGAPAALIPFSPVAGMVSLSVITLVGLVLLTVFGLAVQRVVAVDDDAGTMSFFAGWAWATRHFVWSGLWVLTLLFLITQGAGLFVIPYIVIGPFISFMLYAFIIENFKGMAAVFRARELGKGNWWPLLWRKVAATALFMLPVYLFGAGLFIIYHLSLFTAFESVWFLVVVFAVLVYALFASIWLLRFNVLLFRQLATTRPVTEISGIGADKWKYILLAILGVISLFFSAGEEPTEKDQIDTFWWEQEQTDLPIPDDLKERAHDLRYRDSALAE